MKKNCLVFSLVLIFMLTLFKFDILAYNSVYYNNQIIKVALESMKNSTQLAVTFNGDFTLNNTLIIDGTSMIFTNNGANLSANGINYDLASLIPVNRYSYVTLKSGNISRNYYGSMQLKVKTGNIYPINTVNIEDYVKGVIGYEMSDSYPLEALKSQAVAARTYGAYKISKTSEFDVDDTTNYQVYQGFNSSFINVAKAVDDTKGEFLFYNGYLLSDALFSADNGGYSEDAVNVWGNAVPYLVAKKDDYDDYTKYSNSKNYDRTVNFTAQQLTDLLNKSLSTIGNKFININMDTIRTYTSGRISNLEINYTDSNGTAKIKVLSGDTARTFFGLRSAMYTVTYDNTSDTYTFNTHGYGHGLGMSQIGALNRALAGQPYKDILAFYYNGSIVDKRIASISTAILSSDNMLTGDLVNLQVQGIGGSSSSYLYKYVLEKDGQVIDTSDYSSNAVYSYEIDKVGNYSVTVYFKDVLSSDLYDDKAILNFKATGLADVNLDKTVDIFDLVLISKNIEKTKEGSSNWDIKMDLNKDDVIDVLDLANAAKNYNVKY